MDWSGLKFPVKLDHIVIFEKFNPSISINVFGFEGDVYPLRLSKSKSEQTINLLLISDGEKQHYCLIKSLSRLLSSQLTNHDHAKSFCLNCLNHFPNEEKLKIHEEYCLKNQAIKIEMPEEGSFISFIHHNRSMKVPFVVYADFEAFTEEISSCEPNEFGEKAELLSRKGIYPYDYMNGIKKFSEEKLPPKEKFFSKLNDCNISDEDFDHAQRIWKEFGVKNLGEYHDLYLKSDVLLLADVFEEFRNVCLKNYSLDPAWYYTFPGLSWDALLKYSGVKLELLTDPDILLLFEKGIRGGVSMILNRYGKANNKFMGEKYDPWSPSKYLAYLDANNLYGWAMMKPLPVGDFKWMEEKELKNWKDFPCILEVDLEYPRDLHDLHNDYPLAPERLKINNVEKLIPNLWDKEKYIVHHENLKLYLGLGLKVKKIHRGIKFREKAWMKPYIELNTDLRANGKNDFEKDFFKLMNNSVFGKTIENIRNRVDVKLVNNRGAAEKLSAKPNFEHLTIFDENLVAIHMKRTKLTFNKPVYCGMAILDISKSLMYKLHYGYILPKYGKKAKLLFTDTDSLCYMYEIQTEDFFKDISGDVEDYFDTSNFPKDHPSEIPVGKNKKVPGMMKDEAGGRSLKSLLD